ncbi:MAG TPA: two-component system response regulator KdpE [Accumulibacter sp.]|uniref:two-component system response regulator KdpE n=1 Tax=Accumulibacter sp. TaxID=2053492 RepID=UPI0025E71B49|nr:two-component system response regulator KdpE [Accumulibacter sp.]MCM8598367.1 two-component system response regulator KdpE [Accumulibacter sp.]MCM8662991.1 two-component system response regulator KdpE [Accumulibacter sp.]HNC50776.1 two-component system response regulator KdpE [Accumulibacter sp.]
MKEASPIVIVVEDEAKIRRFVRMSLESEGCQVYEADSVKRGLIETATRKPDMVVLDLGLPDGDGVGLIRDLRTWSDIPVIVLSARTSEMDKVEALDAGADDYLIKPFGTAELLARVRAQLRRRTRAPGSATSILEFGKIRVDFSRRTVERDGEPLHLTPIEHRLLAYLANNADSVLTHRQLLKNVWGPGHVEDAHYVRVYMAHLRKKIEDDPSQPRHILTEAGIGYRFVI